MKVQWKRGSCHKVDAEEAYEVLTEIHQRDGKVTPPAVVEESRPPDAVLHPEFTWDDEKAGEKLREIEAANLIRSLVVVHDKREEEPESRPRQLRVFVRPAVPKEKLEHDQYEHLRPKGSYTLVEDVFSDPVLRYQFIAKAWQELKAWSTRYRNLEEFSRILQVIDEAPAFPAATQRVSNL